MIRFIRIRIIRTISSISERIGILPQTCNKGAKQLHKNKCRTLSDVRHGGSVDERDKRVSFARVALVRRGRMVKKRRKLHGNGRSTRQRASSAKDKRAELNWSRLSARFPPFYARGCAGTWRLVEDFPGNLCPDRAQPRHATSHATPRPADLQFLPLTCVNFRTRISTRTLFQRRKYSRTTLYRDCPVSLDQSGETNFFDLWKKRSAASSGSIL